MSGLKYHSSIIILFKEIQMFLKFYLNHENLLTDLSQTFEKVNIAIWISWVHKGQTTLLNFLIPGRKNLSRYNTCKMFRYRNHIRKNFRYLSQVVWKSLTVCQRFINFWNSGKNIANLTFIFNLYKVSEVRGEVSFFFDQRKLHIFQNNFKNDPEFLLVYNKKHF